MRGEEFKNRHKKNLKKGRESEQVRREASEHEYPVREYYLWHKTKLIVSWVEKGGRGTGLGETKREGKYF